MLQPRRKKWILRSPDATDCTVGRAIVWIADTNDPLTVILNSQVLCFKGTPGPRVLYFFGVLLGLQVIYFGGRL